MAAWYAGGGCLSYTCMGGIGYASTYGYIFPPYLHFWRIWGYLPRVAFNLDYFFKKAHAHGKQALTMCMGLGCNAAGVTACRIIDSPRERLIGIITNNYIPCNGRFPVLITLSTVFIAGGAGGMRPVLAAVMVLGLITLSVVITLVVSRILSCTVLKGLPSVFFSGASSLQNPSNREGSHTFHSGPYSVCSGPGCDGSGTGRTGYMAYGERKRIRQYSVKPLRRIYRSLCPCYRTGRLHIAGFFTGFAGQ